MMSTSPSYILLVDDDETNLLLLEDLLATAGYTTRSAQSGDQALEIARFDPPLLVLLDVMMPQMDGFEVCRQLRLDARLVSTPIIFLTALDDDESRLKGIELTGDDYLTKPVKSSLLLAKVANILRLQKLRSHYSELQIRERLREQLKQQMAVAWEISEALSEKFRLFVPEQFLKRIAPKGVDSIQIGNSTEAEMTVLFCDIREFTTIAESQQAIETFKWLNAFFESMNDAIVSHKGFIDKYLGDAILAVFDRPPYHAQDAINAAIAMRQTLLRFNHNRGQYNLELPLNIGIGIHTGIGLIGTVGSSDRMDSTVIGDVVNTASRLEELTKLYSCQVLVSSTVIENLEDPGGFYVRWVDCVLPRGKSQTVDLYEVLGSRSNPIDAAKIQSAQIFQDGIKAWKEQEFVTALRYFEQVMEADAADSVAALYANRCHQRLESVGVNAHS